ncbi:unnamed protein product [Amoebophrya sp. A25]|nr:unnamed protein product [Amoebophrya sp. A25]|eukprot:GSA25T00009164001.1
MVMHVETHHGKYDHMRHRWVEDGDEGSDPAVATSQGLVDPAYYPPPLEFVSQSVEDEARHTLRAGKKASLSAARVTKFMHDHVPITKWLPEYECSKSLKGDLIGGLIIGLILVCQTMAHAAIATTVTVQGPYCALFPAVVYAIFGTSPHASISSGAVAAVLIADQLSKFGDIETRTRVASYYALVTGLLNLFFGLTKLTFLVRFLSQPTLSGFITGASLIIACTQSKQLTGLDKHLYDAKGVVPILKGTFVNFTSINWVAVGIGVAVSLALHFAKQLKPLLKKRKEFWAKISLQCVDFKELIVVLLSGGLVFILRTPGAENLGQENGLIVNVVGPVPQGVPAFEPPWNNVPEEVTFASLLPGSLLIALTSYITTFSSSRRVALQQGYSIKPSQEAIALGLSGIAGGFFQTFPVSGSLSRAALLPIVGINSQIGGLVASGVVAMGLAFFSEAIYWIPKCTLAGIIMLACTSLQDFPYLAWLVKTSKIGERLKQKAMVSSESLRRAASVSRESVNAVLFPAALAKGSNGALGVVQEETDVLRQPLLEGRVDVASVPTSAVTTGGTSSTGVTEQTGYLPPATQSYPSSRCYPSSAGFGEEPATGISSLPVAASGTGLVPPTPTAGSHQAHKDYNSLGELTGREVDSDFAELSRAFAEHEIKQVPSLSRVASRGGLANTLSSQNLLSLPGNGVSSSNFFQMQNGGAGGGSLSPISPGQTGGSGWNPRIGGGQSPGGSDYTEGRLSLDASPPANGRLGVVNEEAVASPTIAPRATTSSGAPSYGVQVSPPSGPVPVVPSQPSVGTGNTSGPLVVPAVQVIPPSSEEEGNGPGGLANIVGTEQPLRKIQDAIEELPNTAVVGLYRDIAVWLLAFTATILLGVLQGVALAVGLSLFILLADVVFPKVFQMGKLDEHSSLYDVGRARAQDIMCHQFEGVMMFGIGASMFFANIDFIKDEMERMLSKESKLRKIKVVLLIFSQVNAIDATALKELKELMEVWKMRKLHILVADATGEVLDVMEEHFGQYLDQPKVLLTVEECLYHARYRIHQRSESK